MRAFPASKVIRTLCVIRAMRTIRARCALSAHCTLNQILGQPHLC
jgi:hypothetical protein